MSERLRVIVIEVEGGAVAATVEAALNLLAGTASPALAPPPPAPVQLLHLRAMELRAAAARVGLTVKAVRGVGLALAPAE